MTSKIIITGAILISSVSTLKSQDLRSGEITFQNTGGNSYQVTLTLYQDSVSYINRNVLLDWGDSTNPDTLQGGIWTGCTVYNGVVVSRYIGTHSYLGTGVYIIAYSDSFLISGVSNISNSGTEKLTLIDTLIISGTLGVNSSPILANCQDVRWDCCNWIHNPGAVDPDGDSLSYKLISWNTTNYSFPTATLNSFGDLTISPPAWGIYAVAIQVSEWRKYNNQYYSIGNITRYMLLDVDSLSSVNENFFSNKISIYPNPAHNQLNIQLTTKNVQQAAHNYQLSIYNVFGEKVYQSQYLPTGQASSTPGNQYSINVTAWAKGIYFIELKDEKGIRVGARKVIIE